MNTIAQARAKIRRDEKKHIESKLHPCPTVNGFEVLHEHRNKDIVFSAWKGDSKINNREVYLTRFDILTTKGNPYVIYAEEFKWLAMETKDI